MCVVVVANPRKGGVFQTWVRGMIYVLVVGVGVGVGVVGVGWGGGGGGGVQTTLPRRCNVTSTLVPLDLHCKINYFKEHQANRHMTLRSGFKSAARIRRFTPHGTFHNRAYKKSHRRACGVFMNPSNAIIRMALGDLRKPECFLEQMHVFFI